MKKTLLLLFYFVVQYSAPAQDMTRFDVIEQRLNDLSALSGGLNEKADFALSGATIQEFLRGLAESHNLNINIDPQLNFRIYNNFTGEKVTNILMFLVREYDLDIRFVGTIMSFTKYNAPPQPLVVPSVKEIFVRYNNYNNMLSLDLRGDTMNAVAKKITQVTKKNVIPSAEILDRKLNAYIEDMPFDNALEKMAYANNLKIIKTDDNFYLIKPLAEGEDALAADVPKKGIRKKTPLKTNTNNPSIATTTALNVEVTDSIGKKFITADAVNVPILDAIKTVAEETGISYFLFSDIKGNTTTTVANVSFDEFMTYLLQGTDYTYKIEQGIYLVGDRKLEGLRAHKVFQFQYRSLDAVNDVIPAEIKKGVEIKEFKELNSILLTGSLPQINEIISFIKQLDKVVPMITIEVILLDIRKGHSVSTGISAGLADSSFKTGGSIFPGLDFKLSSKSINDLISKIPGGASNIGKVTPNFYISLNAMEKNNNVEVRQMPKLSTLNGHDANLSIGSTRYYSLSTQNVLGSLQPTTVITQQYNSVEANLAINIKPVVSGDDHVTLNIDVNISDFIGDSPAQGPPPTSKSQFKSIVRVRNEEMIVLGGLERMDKSDNGSGFPILSRIPIIKWLFSSRTKSRNKVVSIVFIKPTIIY